MPEHAPLNFSPTETEGRFRTICNIHRDLREHIQNCELPASEKEKVLALITEAYDCGVRMNDALSRYRWVSDKKSWKKRVYKKKEEREHP